MSCLSNISKARAKQANDGRCFERQLMAQIAPAANRAKPLGAGTDTSPRV